MKINPQWNLQELEIYCDIAVHTDKGTGRAVVSQRSDGLILKERNDEILLELEPDISAQSGKLPILKYKVKDFYDMVTSLSEDELAFLREAVALQQPSC